jgi:hypothetical protein
MTATESAPAAVRAFELWRARMDRLRVGEPEVPGAYAAELDALVACSDAEWAQVDAMKREVARGWLTEIRAEGSQS